MPQAARVYDEAFDGHYVELPAAASPAGTVAAPWGVAAEAADSPARLLHLRLVASFESDATPEWKLPARIRLLIVTGAVLTPWALAALAFAF